MYGKRLIWLFILGGFSLIGTWNLLLMKDTLQLDFVPIPMMAFLLGGMMMTQAFEIASKKQRANPYTGKALRRYMFFFRGFIVVLLLVVTGFELYQQYGGLA